MRTLNKVTTMLFLLILLLASGIGSTGAALKIRDIPTTVLITSDNTDLGTITPDGEQISASVTVTYQYDGFIFPLPRNRQPTTITLSASSPSWCTVTVEPTTLEVSADTMNAGAKNANATLTVAVSTDAPAFTTGKIILNASAETNENLLTSYDEYTFTITPDFLPQINAQLSNQSVNLSTGDTRNITLTVTNQANAAITASITSDLMDSENFALQLPNAQTIQTESSEDFTIFIEAIAPENITEITEAITFIVSYTAAEQPDQTESTVPLTLQANIQNEETSIFEIDALLLTTAFTIILAVIVIILLVIIIRKR